MSGTPFRWSAREVRRALRLRAGDARARYRAISTDTRTLRPDDVFVAIAGERFDGHDFIPQAVAAGCAAGVSERDPGECPVDVYLVGDTLKALGDLALHRRLQADIPVVGITGSSGKTTVKDLAMGALSATRAPHGTAANENNRVGTPLTILSMPNDATSLVLELGTNEPGEIAELTRIARPTVSVLTTVSETHVERLGDFAGVLSEKLDLLRGLTAGGRAIVGDEPPALAEAARAVHPDVAVGGWSQRADPALRPRKVQLQRDGTYTFSCMGARAALRLPGAHNVYNAILALAVARFLNVDAASAAAGISAIEPGAMRSEVRRLRELTLLVDCYNANAAGVEAAVRTLEDMAAPGRRVAVLGTMLELGDRSAAIHCETLKRVLRAGIDQYIVTGAFARAARCYKDARIHPVEGVDELARSLPSLARPGDTLLLKASRGVRLERAIPALESRYGGRGV